MSFNCSVFTPIGNIKINGEKTLNSVIQNKLSERDAKELFTLIDQNEDGILQARELYQTMSHNVEGTI